MVETQTTPGTPVPPHSARLRRSKLRPPRLREETVQRERLLRKLAAASDTPVVLISATAGYGKSTLAAQWAARCERPVVWVDLDRGDNDPVVFLSYLTQAVDELKSVAPELKAELSKGHPRINEVVLPNLARELNRLSPVELVLDDVQELTEPASIEILDFLVEETPPESQLVLSTRVDPALPLSRRRVAGELLEIRADSLALDNDETGTLAANTHAALSQKALETLRRRTEGWAAGLRLALQAGMADPRSDGADSGLIAGTKRRLADYLVEVILDHETEEHLRFLLATSVLQRMTAPLCDAILGAPGSSKILRELERSNSFVIALDDHGHWYRYHHLFGELLRSELDRRHPELAQTYLARAAEWLEQDGSDPGEAFRCAHASGDLERAGRIALGSFDTLVNRGQIATARLWLADCTEHELASDPQLAIAAGWLYLLSGEGEKAERLVLAARAGDLDVPSADGATSVRSSLANLRAGVAPHGIHQMLADGEFVYAAEKEANTRWLLGGARGIGTANLLLGRTAEAVTVFREALVLIGERPELAYARTLYLGYLVFALADAGDWQAARKAAREATAVSAEHGLADTIAASIASTAHAQVLVQRGDLDGATAELAKARHLRDLFRGTRWANADMNLRWGDVSLDVGERVAAHEHAEIARAALRGYPDPGLLADRLAELDARIRSASDLGLTPAELRILPFLPTHLSLEEIATRLYLSRTTVKTHVSSIYSKLDASTRSEAVEKMEKLGLHRGDLARDPKRGAGAV